MAAQADKQGIDTGQAGELERLDGFHKAVQIPRVGNQHIHGAQVEQGQHVHGERIDVVQRQRADKNLLAGFTALAQAVFHLRRVGQNVGVGQAGAFGHTGGAAGVLQHGDVFTLGLDGFQVRQVGALFHGRHKIVIAVLGLFGRGNQVCRAGHQHVLNLGVGLDGFQPVQRVGKHHQRFGAGITELMLHFPRRVQRVGVDHHQAGPESGVSGNRVLVQVGQLNGHAVTLLQSAGMLEPLGQMTGLLFQVRKGQCLAQTVVGRHVRIPLAVMLDKFGGIGELLVQ